MKSVKKAFDKIDNKGGYISIETVIVAGLVIGLGAIAISSFQGSASGVVDTALDEVNNVQNSYRDIIEGGN